jgi:long-chain acyl-CoA synthetase
MIKKPWLSHYDSGVPEHISYPSIPIQTLFLDAVEKYPTHACLRYGNAQYSYSEVWDYSVKIAKSLISLGIHPGERIGLILPNIPEFVITYYAILEAGAVAVPLNPAYTLAELKEQINQTQIRLIIGWDQRLEILRQLRETCDISHLIICAGNECKLQFAIEGNGKPARNGKIKKEIEFEQLLHLSTAGVDLPNVNKDTPALFQFSGGTTGTPKAAIALHRNIVANVLQFRNWLTSLKDGQEEFLTVIPLSHVYGMVIGLNVGIAMGATINLIADPRDTIKILETIQRVGISFYPGVPSMYHAINQNEGVKGGKYDLRSIKACISGSAPLFPEIRRQFEKLTGGKLVEGYGLSEAPTATHCNPINGENRDGSIGLPLPDVDCNLILSDEYGPNCGELCIKSPQIMSGYHADFDETNLVLNDGWLRTGDIARMDEDGYFYLVGRKKDLIKVGGLQVWPQEVEKAICKDTRVKEAVVAGIPDIARGEKLKAWVVLNGSANISEEQIIENCLKEIAYFKVPKEIEFIPAIPRTPVGKVLRRELIRRELEKNLGSD